MVEDADFYGPLVDRNVKDNRIEYLGHGVVDGDDAYRLKVTLANGDIVTYSLTPTLTSKSASTRWSSSAAR